MDDGEGFGTICMLVGICAAISWASELQQDKRAADLTRIGKEACAALSVTLAAQCAERIALNVQKGEDADVYDVTRGNGNLRTLKAVIPTIVQNWDRSYGAVERHIQAVQSNGEQPFRDAHVSLSMQSVVQRADGSLTGKFIVEITDPGSQVGRVFEFDHATNNVTQTMGSTTGTFNITGYAGGFGPANLRGSMDLSSTGSVNCVGERKVACDVVAATIAALNDMPAPAVAALRDDAAAGETFSSLDVVIRSFPEYRR